MCPLNDSYFTSCSITFLLTVMGHAVPALLFDNFSVTTRRTLRLRQQHKQQQLREGIHKPNIFPGRHRGFTPNLSLCTQLQEMPPEALSG